MIPKDPVAGLDERVGRGIIAAHGSLEGMYVTASTKFRVAGALKDGVEPGAEARARGEGLVVAALEGLYGAALYKGDWELALVVREGIGVALKAMRQALDEIKARKADDS